MSRSCRSEADLSEAQVFAETARRFVQKEVAAMGLGTEGRDGTCPAGLPCWKAQSKSDSGNPYPQSPGHEYGVWGKACLIDGPAASWRR